MNSNGIEREEQAPVESVLTGEAKNCPLPGRLSQCERVLRSYRDEQRLEAAADRAPSPKALWILDNFTCIQSQIRHIREALPRAYCRRLPRMAKGPYAGEARIYALAVRAVSACGVELRPEDLIGYFKGRQRSDGLLMSELWAIGPMLKLAVIEMVCLTLGEPSHDVSVLRDAFAGLRALEKAPWRDIVESISIVDHVLRADPAGVYGRMDFQTRDRYRHSVEEIARGSGHTEQEIADLAVRLARETGAGHRPDALERHIGHFLIGSGLKELREQAGYRTPIPRVLAGWGYSCATPLYIGGLLVATLTLVAGFSILFRPLPWWIAALLIIPASQAATAMVNGVVNLLAPPRVLPKLDFSDGLPEDSRTFVVIPTLLLSRSGVEKLLERLEIHYLANRDPNLLFGLLTDYPDCSKPEQDPKELLDLCAGGIRSLNSCHGSAGIGPFYLFHRDRTWNEAEGVWMGHERKRGKLVDFNKLLLGRQDTFSTKIGDLSRLPTVRYVITLDSDTRLPRDAARCMIGTLAHPLNRPVIDPDSNTVREGYAILQPRISISMESAARSRLARIYSGQTGFDPYTTAVSDVYHDLHDRATFTGKGIYDLRSFDAVVGDRFPENTLLSHDLIEGEYARTGLITDLELIDDYPATYEAYSKRKHRWVRGDWQTIYWLLPRVPGADGGSEPNPLPAISRWKVADNLRRSVLEPAILLFLLAAWASLPDRSIEWAVLAFILLALPACAGLVPALFRLPPRRFWRAHFRDTVSKFLRAQADAAFSAAFLVHQACLMGDAAVRALVRRFLTHRRLLEWESMAQTEELVTDRIGLAEFYLLLAPFAALALMCALPLRYANSVTIALAGAWAVSPVLAKWLNGTPSARSSLRTADILFLRDIALRTWRYFTDFSGPESNGLAPDNVQENPVIVATRTSPTNIGLQLTASLAAHDFGYIGHSQLIGSLDAVLHAMDRMERYRGHLYNWYDTTTLAPLFPRYVSTVDSGNLAASLLVLKQGCLEILNQPVIGSSLLAGLSDYCGRLWDVIPGSGRTSSITRLFMSLSQDFECEPGDLFHWEGLLAQVCEVTDRLQDHLDRVCTTLGDSDAREVKYWYAALSARARSGLCELRSFAPWLAAPCEAELRLACGDPTLAGLVAELERVSPLAELPGQYDRIGARIQERLASREPLNPAMTMTLLRLSGELPAASEHTRSVIRRLNECADWAGARANEMDFAFLFDPKRKLLRIGYDTNAGSLDESCYDLLASEARTAVFFAIAKGDIPRTGWFHLGRKLVSFGGVRTLVSWGGTMFEYLMPNLFMTAFKGTLLDESLKGVLKIQQAWANERGVPWGTSEAAFNARDGNLSYRYQNFGVPEIALQRKVAGDVVIAPYASMLALMTDRTAAAANLRAMDARGWTGRYGFFEAIDHTAARTPAHRRCVVVRAFMAHHQAMGFLSICNTLLGNPMQRRFHADPLVQATGFLLQERVPLMFKASDEPSLAPEPQQRHARVVSSKGFGREGEGPRSFGAEEDSAAG